MVGLAETVERDRHEGDAAAVVLPEPQKCPPSCEETPSSAAYSVKALSSTRFRLLRVLQRQLVAQLTAYSRGGDIDPRRRPPHSATPQGILIRWLTTDPKRLRGSYLSRGLRARYISSTTPGSEEPGRPSAAPPDRNRAGQSPPPAVCQAAPPPSKHVSFIRASDAVALAEAAADTPLRRKLDASSGSRTSGDTEEGREAPENPKLVRLASPQEGSSAEISCNLTATPVVPSADLIDCAVCLVPFKPVGGGILCTSCLLRLGSTQVALVAPSDGLRTKRCFPGEASHAEQDKKGPLREEDPPSVGFDDQGYTDRRMPKRRRFKSAASATDSTLQQQAQQDQQQQQQGSTEAIGDGGVRRDEEAGWRARATAAAAASSGENSWWGPFEAAGEAPVVPPLLLPLLPSIFSLHARHWPPPPPKRRRFLSRRRRGLVGLTAAASWEVTQLGAPQPASCDAAEPEGQEGGKTLKGNAATAESAAEVIAVGILDMQGATAVRGIAIEGKAAPEAATGREITEQEKASKSLDVGSTYTQISSTRCISPLCCPATSGKPEGSSSCAAICSCLTGAPTAKTSKDGLCFSPAASPMAYAHETLPRRRRGRQREPTGSAGTTGSANLSDDSAVREIAAAAAAVATLKTEEQQREQQTPPSRLRRSCGSDVGRGTAAVAAPTEGKPPVQTGSSTPSSTGSTSKPVTAASAAGGPTIAAGATVELFVGAGAPAARDAAAAPAGPPISSLSSYSPSQDSESGSPVGALPCPPPRHGSLARISQGLIVGRSSLGRGSGLGIYSCRNFSRRSLVCEYSGVLIDRGTALLLRRMRCASHVINVQMQHLYLLGFHTPCPLLGGGAFVNDGRWRTGGGDGPGVSVRFRVMFDRYRATQRVMIVAMKDIKKGEELLTSYDNDYWRLMAQTSQGKQK